MIHARRLTAPVLALAALALFGCGDADVSLELDPQLVGTPTTPTSPDGGGSPTDPVKEPAEPSYSRVLYVSPSGNDTSAGTEQAPLRTMSKAITQLRPGEALYVLSGTYSERLNVAGDAVSGTSSKPITVRAAPGHTPWLKGGTGSTAAMIHVSRAYWIFDGLNVDVAGDKAFAVFYDGAAGNNGIVRNAELKNGTAGAGVTVALGAHDVLVDNMHIHHFVKPGDDSHGVLLQTTSRNVIVRNSDIHHNSGDSVQCLGPEGGATISGTPFDNLVVEDSLLHENRENGADIKTCTNVTLRRNQIWGHRLSTTSRGEGVVVHLSARNVRITENEIYDNGRGISVGGIREGDPPTNVAIVRNRIHSGYNAGGEDGIGIRVDTSTDVRILHNSLVDFPAAALQIGTGDTGNSANVSVKNNIISSAARAVRLGAYRSGLVIERNLYHSPSGSVRLYAGGEDFTLGSWKSATGLDSTSLEANPGFVAPPADLRLAKGSVAIDAAMDLGLPFCGNAPDLGAVEADCP